MLGNLRNHKISGIFSPISKLGFTLMELLIAIAILGILAGIGTIAFSAVQEKGRDTKRKQDLSDIKIALEAYHADFNQYPPASCSSPPYTYTSDQPQPWIADLSPVYLKELPKDPKDGFVYRLDISNNCQNFILWAELENENDREIHSQPTAACTQTPPVSTTFNYCIQNP